MLDVFNGKRLHELGLDDVRSLLDDTQAEPLHWEAKGVELKPGEVRKQICGFANSHDGGYLILGTHVSGGKWVIDGLPFPNDDPPAWVSNIARGVQPYPENLDTHAIPVAPSLSTSGETLTIEESMNLEGENGERRTCCRRARMELEQRLRLLPPAAETSLA